MKQNLQVYSGNRIVVLFDGTLVGLLQDVNPTDDYAPDAASGVGDIHVQEWVPTMAHHTIRVTNMILIVGSLRSIGIVPENGDAVLKGNVFDIQAQSKDTGQVLRKWVNCSYASGNIQVRKHAILLADAQFNALDVAGTLI